MLVVSTRNNTLPLDLLNGCHLSLSGRLWENECFVSDAFYPRPAEMNHRHFSESRIKKNVPNRIDREINIFPREGRWKGERMKSDCWLHSEIQIVFSVIFTVLGGAVSGAQNIFTSI